MRDTELFECRRRSGDLAEVAAGVVDVAEIPDLAAHLDHCTRCRLELDELTSTADRLMLLSPEMEPPPGFEASAMSSFRIGDRDNAVVAARKPRARWLIAVVAAAVLVAGVVGGAYARNDGSTGSTTSALAHAQISNVRTAALVDSEGEAVGSVVELVGKRTTVVMSLNTPVPGSTYRCEATRQGQPPQLIGTWTPDGRSNSWIVEIDTTPTETQGFRVTSASGETYDASLTA